jgi:hypothetical protein
VPDKTVLPLFKKLLVHSWQKPTGNIVETKRKIKIGLEKLKKSWHWTKDY